MPQTTTRPSKPAPAYRLRRSSVHGTGLFATRTIRKGAFIIEYIGERISHAEADRRCSAKATEDGHTFFFTVDAKTVIDGGVGGNASRFINHSCEPNCEAFIEGGRLFMEATRTIRRDDEIVYQYRLNRGPDDSPDVDGIYACHCGTASCQGTMLEQPKKRRRSSPSQAARARRSSR